MVESQPVEENPVEEVSEKIEPVDVTNDAKIYYAPAKKFQLANFREEVRSQGTDRVLQGEQSLVFENHLFVTDNEDEIEFIEKSNAYKSGIIKMCGDMGEAQALVNVLRKVKSTNTTISTEDVTKHPTVAEGKGDYTA